MIVPRETIYAALFTQISAALLTPTGPFKTVSRRWIDPSQVSPADRPCLYQVQTGEIAQTSQSIAGLPIKWQGKVDFVMYTSGDSSDNPASIPSQELNSLLDATERGIAAAVRGLAQTLGGTVYTARIDGKIEIVENVAGMMAMAVIPILLVQGS